MLFILFYYYNEVRISGRGRRKIKQTAHLDSAIPAKTKCSNGYSGESKPVIEKYIEHSKIRAYDLQLTV
jgi:hypothetical protein